MSEEIRLSIGLIIMHIRMLIISGFYSLLQATAGLLVHPYQTMQQIVQQKVLIFLTFIPTVFGILATLLWWLGLKYLFLHLPHIGLWAFSAIWIAFFFTFWQILLIYLLFRFLITFRKK